MKPIAKAVLSSLFIIASIISPVRAQSMSDKGTALEKQGRYAEAQKVYEEILARDGNNASAHFRLGLIHLSHIKNIDLAMQHLEKAVDLDGKNAEYHFRLAEACTVAAQNASILKRPGLTRQVKTQLELAIQLNPRSVAYHQGLIRFYCQAPAVLGGSYSSAHQQADALSRVDGLEGALAHAEIYFQEGNKGRAQEFLRKAIAANPRDSRAYHKLGVLYLLDKKYDEAIPQLKKHVELDPRSATGFYDLGDAYFKKQMYNEAVSAFTQAIQKDSGTAPAYFDAAQCYEKLGQKQDALKYYKLFVARFPSAPRAPMAKQKINELSRG
jgi:superkiller protein 3